MQPTAGRSSCLVVQPGLQFARLAVPDGRTRKEALSRGAALAFAIGHQERVLAKADRLSLHQAFLLLLLIVLAGERGGRRGKGNGGVALTEGRHVGGHRGEVEREAILWVHTGEGVGVAGIEGGIGMTQATAQGFYRGTALGLQGGLHGIRTTWRRRKLNEVKKRERCDRKRAKSMEIKKRRNQGRVETG